MASFITGFISSALNGHTNKNDVNKQDVNKPNGKSNHLESKTSKDHGGNGGHSHELENPVILPHLEVERPQCFTEYNTLPHSLFSHIHLDHLLVGSYLQTTTKSASCTDSSTGRTTLLKSANFPLKEIMLGVYDYVLSNDTGISKESMDYLRANEKNLKQDFATIEYFHDFSEKMVEAIKRKPYVTSKLIDGFIMNLAQRVYDVIEKRNEVLFEVKWTRRGEVITTDYQMRSLAIELMGNPNTSSTESVYHVDSTDHQNMSVGHAMCAKVIRNKDNSHVVLIMNTGGGIPYHLTKENTQIKHRSTLAFHIPKETTKEDVIKYIKELLSPGIKGEFAAVSDKSSEEWRNESEYTQDDFYAKVAAKAYLINAHEINPKKLLSLKTEGQLSGICATKIWFPILYSRIQNKPFHEFLLQLRYQTILDYYRILKTKNSLSLPIVSHTLIPACQKLARTIEKYNKRARRKKDIIISKEHGEKILQQLRTIEIEVQTLAALRDAQEQSSIDMRPEVVFDNTPKLDSSRQPISKLITNPLFVLEKLEAQAKKETKEVKPIPIKLLPKSGEFKYPLDFLKACYEILTEYDKSEYWSYLIHETDKIFFAMPSDYKTAFEYWNQIKQEDLKDTLRYLRGIMDLYERSCCLGSISNNLLPRQILTANICSLMASFITQKYYSNHPKFSIFSYILPRETFITEPTHAVSFDPAVDKKVAEFEKLAAEIRSKDKDTSNACPPKIVLADITEICDYYDSAFLEHYIDEKTLRLLDETRKHEDAGHFENARINFYRYCRSIIYKERKACGDEVPECFCYSIDTIPDPKIAAAVKDYLFFLYAYQLHFNCQLFSSKRRYTVPVIHPKVRNNCLIEFNKLQYSSWTREDERGRKMFDGRKVYYVFGNWERNCSSISYGSFYSPSSELAMWALNAKSKIFDVKYRHMNDYYMSNDEKKAMEQTGVDSSNTKLVNIFNEISLDNSFSVRSFALHDFMKAEARLVLSRDFYDTHLELLSETDHEMNLMQQVFQPHCLMRLLDSNPGFANNLHVFLKKAVNFHTQNQEITKGGIFVYHFCYHLLTFLKAHPKQDRLADLIHWIEGLEKGFLEILNLYKTLLKNNDYLFGPYETIVRTIENLNRLYCIIKSLHQEKDFSAETIKILLSCELFSTINKIEVEYGEKAHIVNPFFEEAYFSSRGRLRDKLKSQFMGLSKEIQEKIIREIVQELLIPDFIPDSKFNIAIQYPCITVRHGDFKVEFDLYFGSIINSQQYFTKKKVGAWSSVLEGLFGKSTLYKILVNDKILSTEYTFRNNEKDYKITYAWTYRDEKIPKELQGQHVLQQKLKDGKEYSLLLHSNLQKSLPVELSDIAFDFGKRWWQTIDPEGSRKFYCTDEQLNYFYEVSETVDSFKKSANEIPFKCYQLKPDGTQTGYSLVTTKLHPVDKLFQHLKRFEDARFIELWQAKDEAAFNQAASKSKVEKINNKTDNCKYLLCLLRYNLEWEGRANKKGEVEFLWTKNKDFRLLFTPVHSYVPEFKNFLAMENKKTGERIVLVPKQKFLVTGKADKNIYHALHYDVSNKFNEYISHPDRKNYLSGYPYRHKDSCQYEIFRIREKLVMNSAQERKVDEWVADTPAGCLFLAYLCLAKYHPELAMKALKEAQKLGGIRATFDEVGFINDILTHTPHRDYKPELVHTVTVKEPNMIAVKLYAAGLLFDQKLTSFDTPGTPFPSKKDSNTLNDYLSNSRISEVYDLYHSSSYYSGFADKMRDLYFSYLRALEHISHDLKLSDENERAVILGIAARDNLAMKRHINRMNSLEMTHTIKQREKILFNLTKHNMETNQLELNELKANAEKIKSNMNTVGLCHQLEFQEVPLDCEHSWHGGGYSYYSREPSSSVETGTIDQLYYQYLKDERGWLTAKSPVLTVDQLDVNTAPNDFIRSWISFYTIASQPGNGDLKKKLGEFALLWLHYKNATDRFGGISGEVPYLCRMLLYILKNPMPTEKRIWDDIKKEHNDWLEGTWPIHEDFNRETLIKFVNAISARCLKFSKADPIKIKMQKKKVKQFTKPLQYFNSLEERAQMIKEDIKEFEMLCLKTNGDNKPLTAELSLKNFYELVNNIQVPSLETPEIFPAQKDQDPFFVDMNKNFCLDLQEGMKQNARRKQQEKIFNDTLASRSLQKQVLKQLDYNFNHEEIELQNLRYRLLEKANLALTGPMTSHSTRCDISGQTLSPINFQTLLWLYLQADISLFTEKTRLSRVEMQDLYQSTHEYLIRATVNKHRARVMQQLNILLKMNHENPEYSDALVVLGEQLVATRAYNPDTHPEILIFEYLDDKMLRPEQVGLLESLLKSHGTGFNNEVIQLIMGGGKSKVLLPLLALKKALGTNLSIIEVPSALFETNKTDLKSTTMSLFGVDGITIDFERGSPINVANLFQLRNKLNDARMARQYIITHGDATKSMQLKYLELLEGNSADEKVIALLESILLIYRNRGDVIIDEGDTVLDPKLELNYPAGVPSALPIDVLATVQKFFRLFSKVKVMVASKEITLQEVALGRAVIVLDSDWDVALERLLDIALTDPSLDYYKIIKELPKNEIGHFKKFLLNKEQSLPECAKTLTEQERNALGFIKGQLALFKHCLRQKSNEHYGFPVSKDFQGSRHVAIPYVANNTPNEKSEFGMIYEIINYTLLLQEQRTLIPLELLKRLVEEFKFRAKQEVAIKFGRVSIEETKVNKEFIELTTLSLNTVYPNEHLLLKAQPIISASVKARDYVVLNYILAQIKDYPYILRANAINHVAQYRSAQTMTGTPWNADCFHPRFRFDQEKSFGTDGRTIDLLLQKNPPIKLAMSEDPARLIEDFVLKHPKTHKIHALIDVGALFKGLGNEMIARLLCRALGSRPGNTVKHVLFYNQDNILCALPCRSGTPSLGQGGIVETKGVKEVNENIDAPIILAGSDPKLILQKIGSRPDECFTYYDQRHTTGTDIKQAFDAIGIVTVDRDTKMRDLLQGVMRLRELRKSQGVEIVLPLEVSQLKVESKVESDISLNASGHTWGIKDVFQLVQRNQSLALANFNLRATMDKMDHVIRELMLIKIYAAGSLNEKRKLRTEFAEAFLYTIPKNPFPLTEGEFESKKILDNYFDYNIEKYKRLLAKIDLKPTEEEMIELKKVLLEVKDRALKRCLIRYENSAGIRDNSMQNMKQKEQESQRQVERTVVRATDKTTERAVYHKKWNGVPDREENDSGPVQYLTMNAAIKCNNPNVKWDFSGAIKMTENFTNTIEGQKNNMGKFVKPIQFFIVIKDPGAQSLRIIILCPEEFQDFLSFYYAKIDELKKQGYEIWIKSTHDVLLAGTSETIDPIRFPDYKMLLEQIRFFNGDIDLLIQERCSDWMLSDLKHKFESMRNIILPNHAHQNKYMEELELTIMQEINEHQQSKINTETLAVAVKESNLESLDTLLKELTAKSSIRARKYLLNSPFGSKQDDLLGLAIQKGDVKIIKRLLAEPELLSYLSYDRNPLRACAAKFNREIFEILLADTRCYPENTNLEHWVEITREILATHNDNIILPFLTKAKSLMHPRTQALLNPALFTSLFDKEIPYINTVLGRIHLMMQNPEEVWRLFLIHIAKNNKKELFIKVLEDWYAKAPNQKVFEYITNAVKTNEPCLLQDLSDVNLELIKFILEEKKNRFKMSHEHLDRWITLLFAENIEQLIYIKNYIKDQTLGVQKTPVEAQKGEGEKKDQAEQKGEKENKGQVEQKNDGENKNQAEKGSEPEKIKVEFRAKTESDFLYKLQHHPEALKKLLEISDKMLQKLQEEWRATDHVKANNAIIRGHGDRFKELLEFYPHCDDKKLIEELVTKLLKYQIENHQFHNHCEIFKNLFPIAGEIVLKIIDKFFKDILTKHHYWYVRDIFSAIDFSIPINGKYGLPWFKQALELYRSKKEDNYVQAYIVTELFERGLVIDSHESRIEAFLLALDHNRDIEVVRKRMVENKISPDMIYQGRPLLYHCMYEKSLSHIHNLLRLKADANVRYKALNSKDNDKYPGAEYNGYTPAMLFAAKDSWKWTLGYMLEAKADPHVKSPQGKTALDIYKERFPGWASSSDNRDIVSMLTEAMTKKA